MNASTRYEYTRLIADALRQLKRYAERLDHATDHDTHENDSYVNTIGGIVVALDEIERAGRQALAHSRQEQRESEQCHHNGQLQEGR